MFGQILYSTRIELGRECINAAETNLVGELGKAHHHKLVSAFEADGMSIAVVSLYALVELISWYERHNLSEYGLSLIHDFCICSIFVTFNALNEHYLLKRL